MSVQEHKIAADTIQAESLDKCITAQKSTPIYPIDPLRREFIGECLDHVAELTFTARRAISVGDDKLYKIQMDLIRLTLRAQMDTFNEMERIVG